MQVIQRSMSSAEPWGVGNCALEIMNRRLHSLGQGISVSETGRDGRAEGATGAVGGGGMDPRMAEGVDLFSRQQKIFHLVRGRVSAFDQDGARGAPVR